MRTIIVLLAFALHATLGSFAQQERRMALVLANEDYPVALGRLNNTHEDAEKVERALRDTGFEVTKVLDADAATLRDAVTQFELDIDHEAEDGDNVVAFVYASMHGAAADVDGRTRNFLLPAREPIRSTGELIRKGIRMDQLISGLSSTDAAAVLVVSDACRNELGTSFSKSTNKGFVPVRSRPGVLVAYATAPGATTPDDGMFADLLARELREPGRKASFAMLEAIESVASRRSLEGQPFLSSGGLPEWLCFNGCARTMERAPLEMTAALNALNSENLEDLRAFIDDFPESEMRGLVEREIANLQNVSNGSDQVRQAPSKDEVWEQYAGLVIAGCEDAKNQDNGVCMINQLAWSPNGAMIAAAMSDGMVRIFDNVTGQELSNWSSGYEIAATDIAWGPESERLALSSLWSNSVRVFDARRAFEIGRVNLSGAGPLNWDRKSRQLLVANRERVSWVEFKPGGLSTLPLSNEPHGVTDVRDIAFEKDTILVAGETGEQPHAALIKIGDPAGYSNLIFPDAGNPGFASRHVASADISPDRRRAIIGTYNGWVYLFDLETGAVHQTIIEGESSENEAYSSINAVDWSPDGQRVLVTDEDARVRIFDANTGLLLTSLATNKFNSEYAAFNPSGDRIAVASIDGTLRLWRLLDR